MATAKKSFGSRLRAIRELRGYTQQQAANGARVDASSLSRWENDKVMPGSDELRSLCIFYGASADELLGLTGKGQMQEPVADPEWQKFLATTTAKIAREHGVIEAVWQTQLPGVQRLASSYEAIAWQLIRLKLEQSNT